MISNLIFVCRNVSKYIILDIKNICINFYFSGFKGFVRTEGKMWKVHRRFALTHLKNIGFGKATFDQQIQEEADCLISDLYKCEEKKNAGEEYLSLIQILTKFTNNVISAMIFGKSCAHDPDFQLITDKMHETAEMVPRMSNIFVLLFFQYALLNFSTENGSTLCFYSNKNT